MNHAHDPDRRRLLRYGVNALGMIAAGNLLSACGNRLPATKLVDRPLDLVESDVDGLLLPQGFSARIVARTGEPVIAGSNFRWHAAPDGGAVFGAPDGGWIYVSNSEMDDGNGGASALRFDRDGNIVDAYPVLTGTMRNCAGGPTPWNTWLSCEEVENGQVWECDPYGRKEPRGWPALGRFNHEAVAVDPRTLQLYLTEDRRHGRFYRFTPSRVENGIPDLSEGRLEVAAVSNGTNGRVTWKAIDDPAGTPVPTRNQVTDSTEFHGGEGCWYSDGFVYFTTKYDNRVWAYDVRDEQLDLVYDDAYFADPKLTGVDNVTVSQQGTIYVAEDGGNMQIVAIDPGQNVYPVIQLLGHERSEVTGPAFDASGTRLYFSSQRGRKGSPLAGITYEVTGPFA